MKLAVVGPGLRGDARGPNRPRITKESEGSPWDWTPPNKKALDVQRIRESGEKRERERETVQP